MNNDNIHSEFSIHSILDFNLSAEAKILLIKALSVPKNWIWRKKQIMDMLNVGESRLRTVFTELKECKVLSIKKIIENGRLNGSVICIDIRQIDVSKINKNNTCSRDVELPRLGKPTCIDNNIYTINSISTVDSKDVELPRLGKPTSRCKIDAIPSIMTGYRKWVYWKNIIKEDEKPIKIPFYDVNKCAKVSDQSTWRFFKDVKDFEKKKMSGIGFVLTESDPFTIIDLDKCIIDGTVNNFAKNVINYFDSYTEFSPSGTGFHIIILGKSKIPIKRKEIEIYYKSRYMAMTGNVYFNKSIENRQEQLEKTIKKYGKSESIKKPYKNKIPNNGKFTMPKEVFSEGQRNNELARWAGILNKKNLSENEYFQYLHAINIKCCIPPLPDGEVNHVGNSIKRYR